MSDPQPPWLILVPVLELAVLIAAGAGIFRRFGRTLSEAVASSILLCLMVISLLGRAALIHPVLAAAATILEAGMAAAACVALWRLREREAGLVRAGRDFWFERNRMVMAGLFVCWGFMAFKGLSTVPGGSFPAMVKAMTANKGSLGFFPSNTLVLSRHFTRFGLARGMGIFGFLGYLAIVFSTYALSRRYAWLPVAFTAAVAVACFPRFVLHAMGPGLEIVPAAAALFAVLCAYRFMESPGLADLFHMILAIGFVCSHDGASLVFAGLLTALCSALLVRRHGTSMVMMALGARWRTLVVLAGAVFLARPWAWFAGSLFQGMPKNRDELLGGMANALRYLLDSMDVTRPVEESVRILWGLSPYDPVMTVYTVLIRPVLGDRGADVAFQVADKHGEVLSWFGPVASVLVPGAVILAMIRGPRRLKLVGLALGAYVYLISLILAWRPDNVRFFSFVYAVSGYFLAYLLPPWRLGRSGLQGLQLACIIGLFYMCFLAGA